MQTMTHHPNEERHRARRPTTESPAITARGLVAHASARSTAVGRPRPHHPARRDLRPPRTQRRRQVDDREDALHAARTDGRAGDGGGLRHRPAPAAGAPPHRRRAAGRRARPEADRASSCCACRAGSTGSRTHEIEQRLVELRELVDLGDALDRRIDTYSGGMRRRLDLAAALVHNPDVLFLDEPTTGLDPISRASVWQEVQRLNDELGMTILLTTQYLEEADELADRVGIVDRGRLVAEGTPDRAQAHHRHRRGRRPHRGRRRRRRAGARRACTAWSASRVATTSSRSASTTARRPSARSPSRSTTRRSGSATSRCARRRSTTCSSS